MRKTVLQREGQPLIEPLWIARTPWQRLRGLIGRAPLRPREGLLLAHCRSVHTFGMRTALDIVFLDEHGKILKCAVSVPPLRLAGARGARHTLELSPGTVQRLGLGPQQVLRWGQT